jgi:hypothetical protein
LSSYRLVVRSGARVERTKLDSLDAALDTLESRARELSDEASEKSRTVDTKLFRKFEPIQQVAARLELAGPSRLRAGVDVRGDGSLESYTGRLRRRLIEQRDGESPFEALRRELSR